MKSFERVPPRGSSFLRNLLIGLDAAALMLSWFVAIVLVPTSARSVVVSALLMVAWVGGGLAVFSAMGLYRSRVCVVRTLEFERLARACLIIALLALSVAAVGRSVVSPIEIAIGTAFAFSLTAVLRSSYRTWLTNGRRLGRHMRPVLLIGTGCEAAEIAALLREHPGLGYQTVGIIGEQDDALRNGLLAGWRGDIDDALAVLDETRATGVIICASDLHSSQLNRIVQDLLDADTHVQLSSGLHGIDIGRLRPSPLAHEPLFYVEHSTLASWQLATKRLIDLVLSAVLLTLTAPLIALAAFGIKLQDRGPVLFKQRRIGRSGTPFVLYKLRTMREGAEGEMRNLLEFNARDGPLTKIPHDPRVTTLGRILRSTSIDELPQLWNVLNGTMSLVGPRPALPHEVEHFDAELRARESVPPGITGLWQVEGRDNPSFAAYRRLDLFYVQNWSVALDVTILIGTVESILARALRSVIHRGEDIQLAPIPHGPAPARIDERTTRLPPSSERKEGLRAR